MASNKDLALSFAIEHLKDRREPDAKLWVSSDEFDSYANRYFIAYQLPTEKYKLLIPPFITAFILSSVQDC